MIKIANKSIIANITVGNHDVKSSPKMGCSECGSPNLCVDEQRGEQICSDCGLVNQERVIMQNCPQFSKPTNGGYSEFIQNGPPVTALSIGLNFQTTMGKDTTTKQQRLYNRLRMWDNQMNPKEKNLMKAFVHLRRVASILHLPNHIKNGAAKLYKKCLKANLIQGKSIIGMMAASVYFTCRTGQVPVYKFEIIEAFDITFQRFNHSFRALLQELRLYLPVLNMNIYFQRAAEEVGLDASLIKVGHNILHQYMLHFSTRGKNRMGIVSALVYFLGRRSSQRITQANLSYALGVSEVTLRQRVIDLQQFIKRTEIAL